MVSYPYCIWHGSLQISGLMSPDTFRGSKFNAVKVACADSTCVEAQDYRNEQGNKQT